MYEGAGHLMLPKLGHDVWQKLPRNEIEMKNKR